MTKKHFLIQATTIIFFTQPLWGMNDSENERKDFEEDRQKIHQEISKIMIEEVKAIVEESDRLHELWLRYYQPKSQEMLKDQHQHEAHWNNQRSNL